MGGARLFVPGRVCLFGEHSDWAGGRRSERGDLPPGRCIVAGTDQGIEADASDAEGLAFVDIDGREARYAFDERLVPLLATPDFYRFQLGAALEARRRFPGLPGLRLVETRRDLPVRKGLSSSAAACVLVARAFSRVYGLNLSVEEEMEIAYRGERLTGSECGRMDQACAFGRKAMDLLFDGDRMEAEPLRVGAPVRLAIVDLRRGKDTVKILRDLNRCFAERDDAVARGVREALGPRNAEIAERARRLLEFGDARGLGELMTEGQRLFDRLVAPACPEELAAPRLHEVLAYEPIRDLVWGGKGVGSQGDGSAQFVARGQEAQRELLKRLPEELGVECFPLTLGE